MRLVWPRGEWKGRIYYISLYANIFLYIWICLCYYTKCLPFVTTQFECWTKRLMHWRTCCGRTAKGKWKSHKKELKAGLLGMLQVRREHHQHNHHHHNNNTWTTAEGTTRTSASAFRSRLRNSFFFYGAKNNDKIPQRVTTEGLSPSWSGQTVDVSSVRSSPEQNFMNMASSRGPYFSLTL